MALARREYGAFNPLVQGFTKDGLSTMMLLRMLTRLQEFINDLISDYCQWKWLWSLAEQRVDAWKDVEKRELDSEKLTNLHREASLLYHVAEEVFEIQCGEETQSELGDEDKLWVIRQWDPVSKWLHLLQDRNSCAAQHVAWWIGLIKWLDEQLNPNDQEMQILPNPKELDEMRLYLSSLTERLKNFFTEAIPDRAFMMEELSEQVEEEVGRRRMSLRPKKTKLQVYPDFEEFQRRRGGFIRKKKKMRNRLGRRNGGGDEGGEDSSSSTSRSSSSLSSHQCEDCGRGFSTAYDLKRHSFVHSGVRPYPCGQCDKSYVQKSDLTIHLRTHTGERPFRCKHCAARFRSKGSLTYHLTHVHKV